MDVNLKDLRVNPIQLEEVEEVQTTRFDRLFPTNAMVWVKAMLTLRKGAQRLDPLRSLLS